MGEVALFSMATTGLKLAGNMGQASAQRGQAKIDAIRMRTQAEAARTRESQIDASFRDDLNTTMASIAAIRAAQNVSIDSPTTRALMDRAEDNSRRARIQAKSNERMKAMGLDADADILLRGSRRYTAAALLQSAPDLLSSAQTVYRGLPSIVRGSP